MLMVASSFQDRSDSSYDLTTGLLTGSGLAGKIVSLEPVSGGMGAGMPVKGGYGGGVYEYGQGQKPQPTS